MSYSVAIYIDTKELERIAGNLETNADEIIRGIAFEAEGYAKGYAPYDTGALMSSIHTINMGNAWRRIQPEVHYAIYQELGTWKMAAHPFLTPAIEGIANKFLSPQSWSPLFK